MTRTLTRRLAVHGHARQTQADRYATATGNAVDNAVGHFWQQVRNILATTSSPLVARHRIMMAAHHLMPAMRRTFADGMTRLGLWAHQSAAAGLLKTLPPEYLARALVTRPSVVREAVEFEPISQPGVSIFGLNEAPFPLGLEDLDFIRDLPDELGRHRIAKLLFPSPSYNDVFHFVNQMQLGGWPWEKRMAASQQRWNPHLLADIVAGGYAEGLSQQQIARRLLPAMDGLRTNARRLARTYGMAVAHHEQWKAHRQLGDLVIGWQVHATLDMHTRPEHRARDGEKFYFEPGPGEKDMSDCPHPPLEASGEISWNCRCFITPLLRAE